MSPSFASSWLAGDQNARRLLPAPMLDRQQRAQVAAQALTRPTHPAVLAAMADLQHHLPPRPLRDANLALLASGKAVAVVTGQQLGLFHGPLFTLHKAATAVAAARRLQEETGIAAVPVFWLQSEDHDDAEIDHAWIPRPPGPPVKLHAPLNGPPRASVGALQVAANIEQILASLDELLRGLPHAAAVVELLSQAWQPGRPLALAVALQMDALLGDAGLLIVDPRHPAMALAAAPVHGLALQHWQAIELSLTQRGHELRAAGFEPQVQVRAGSPLSFVAPQGDGASRYRIQEREDGRWGLAGGDAQFALGTDQLLALLAAHPEQFSTSALLRPLLQDSLLPCAAYVGGPAELGYLAQIQPLYELLGVAASRPVLRAGFTWLEPWMPDLMRQWQLQPADLRDPKSAWQKLLGGQAMAEVSAQTAALQQQLWPVQAADWQRLTQPLAALDPSLEKAAQRTHQQVAEAVDKLMAKYGRALAARQLGDQHKLERAHVLCWPNGAPQERFYAWPWFAARFGIQRLTAAALDLPDPFGGSHRWEAL